MGKHKPSKRYVGCGQVLQLLSNAFPSRGSRCKSQNLLINHRHTSYLSFLLHRQDFRKPNFTPKKTTKSTKNTKNVSEEVKYMHFFTQSGKIYT